MALYPEYSRALVGCFFNWFTSILRPIPLPFPVLRQLPDDMQ